VKSNINPLLPLWGGDSPFCPTGSTKQYGNNKNRAGAEKKQ